MPLPPAAESGSTDAGIPVAPGLETWIEEVAFPHESRARTVALSALAIGIAIAAGLAAQALTRLIGAITNLSFYGRWSTEFVSPADHQLGWLVIFVPIAGAIVVGCMARYGSAAIRGHGIPEAMEQVLLNQSRIPARLTILKPLSAAISIGTGGPFGAEGPIIATGGALGSLVGQLLRTTANERKTLLAAGAAAGMAATFGSPVSAVLLAIELLLFEYRPRSIVPVAFAAAAATAVRVAFQGTAPVFAIADLAQPDGAQLAIYVLIGALVGVASVAVTRAVYWIEDRFEHLPIHWMWWPAIGAVAVGVVGYFAPHTMGVGYDNIERTLSGDLAGRALIVLCILKFVSWSIALGSGTSGGTLAPLFTIGGGLGAALGAVAAAWMPQLGIDPRVGGLIGMAAMFAGASRALLASVVFAFETTRQPLGLLPLLGGCSAGFLVSSLLMRHSIMTERLARRGKRVPSEYSADYLEQVTAGDVVSSPVVTIRASQTIGELREWIHAHGAGSSHQGFPVVESDGQLVGVATRRDILDADRQPDEKIGDALVRALVVVYADDTLRRAADLMLLEQIGRLPVVERADPTRLLGILTRSDLIEAHRDRLVEQTKIDRSFSPSMPFRRKAP